jgi:molybdate transport system substrate-binding protein
MPPPIRILSSMATRQVLAELVAQHGAPAGPELALEAVGGVDVARRVRAGEAVDVVVLAADTIGQLTGEGRILAGRSVELVRSGIAVAVRKGSPRIDIGTEEALRQAVAGAARISYSTGPSGVYLMQLLQRWGLADTLRDRIVQAGPGVPVGSLVAQGQVELGFQQLSELIHLPGIEVLGPLPPAIQLVTTFVAGVASSTSQPEAACELLRLFAAPEAAALKRRHGMDPA